MTEGTGPKNDTAELIKQLDQQSRFNRMTIVICAFAIAAVQFVTMTVILETLPGYTVLTYIEKLDTIVPIWKHRESMMAHKTTSSQPAAATPAQ